MGLSRYKALRIMGLEEGCTSKEVRDRFKKLALKWHPDKNIHNPDDAQRKFQAISAAYTKLVSTEEENDDIPTDTLREMFAEIWQSHNSNQRPASAGEPHLFCDCDDCQADWEDISLDNFIGSDSDPDDDFYYDDTLYADDLLKEFGDKLYRNFNVAEKKTKNSWTGAGYRERMTEEEASRHADELLKAEEKEKRQAEKKKKRNKKKKESKKRKKAKQQDDGGCVDDAKPEIEQQEEEEEEEEEAGEEEREVECDTKKEESTPEKVVVVDKKDETVQPELNKALPEAKERAVKAVSQPVVVPVVSAVSDQLEEEEEEEEEEDPILSEDELDLSSAFVKQAKASAAAARATKSKEKTSTATADRNRESEKKPKGPTPNPKPVPNQYESQPTAKIKSSNRIRNRKTVNKEHVNRKPVNREPVRSKETVDINGSVPVISTSNGYEASPVVEEEDDDLSPVDRSKAQLYEANIPQSKQLAGEGNRAAKAGQFEEAVRKYSEAISLYPFDHRYFGNRSFCYDYLHEYSKALDDANSALKIDITWAKGFYRRGRGLAGLKRYEAAVSAFLRALDLNPQYAEAREQLEAVQLEQLQSMGFLAEASKAALAEYHTVTAAVDALVNRTGGGGGAGGHKKRRPPASNRSAGGYTPVYNHSGFEIPPRMLPQSVPPQNCALWVGNVTSTSVTQNMLANLFQRHGPVASVRMLYERQCAFVNYHRPESAAAALKKLQGHTIAGCTLLLRYPDNAVKVVPPPPPVQRPKSKRTSSTASVEECYFWRSTGCSYGDQCRYLHLPESQGVDAAAGE